MKIYTLVERIKNLAKRYLAANYSPEISEILWKDLDQLCSETIHPFPLAYESLDVIRDNSKNDNPETTALALNLIADNLCLWNRRLNPSIDYDLLDDQIDGLNNIKTQFKESSVEYIIHEMVICVLNEVKKLGRMKESMKIYKEKLVEYRSQHPDKSHEFDLYSGIIHLFDYLSDM